MTRHPIHLPDAVLEEARQVAEREGMSVDDLVVAMVTDALRHLREREDMRRRAARGDPELGLAILDRAPDGPAEDGDKMLEEPPQDHSERR